MFDFKFPTVSFVEKSGLTGALVIPYHVKDDVIVLNKHRDLHSLLPKNSNGTLSSVIRGQLTVFVCVKEDSIETPIIGAIMSVPDAVTDITVNLGSYKFNDKVLVSRTLLNLKVGWNLKKKEKEDPAGKNIEFVVRKPEKYSTIKGQALAEARAFVEQLVNMPPNYLTPTKFAELVQDYISEKDLPITCETFGVDYILEQKMGSFYGVAKGSSEEPRLIVLHYGPKVDNPIVMVGKGLTFDSGGISIKPSGGMHEMKSDMAGAATALCSVIYAAAAGLPVSMVAVAACCENMPSGSSVKPGDVLTAMDGTTIEVIDTDAEGRLVLADALTYAKQFNGKYTIDLATLTGACIVALGHTHTGLFSQDDALADSLLAAGKSVKDEVWRLPLEDCHKDFLKSNVADVCNLAPGKGAGATQGAVFLQNFAPEKGWCHLDIAGTSWSKGGSATSRPMPLISEFLDRQ
jgi:leucyl aminopeptidase